MGIIGALKTTFHICRIFLLTLRSSCQWLLSHLIVLGTICALFLALIFFPCVPRFVISCVPILICTAVLVKVLLSLGSQNSAQSENEEKTISGSSSSSSLCELERREGFSIETRLKKKKGIRERALEKSGVIMGGKGLGGIKEKKVAFSPRPSNSLMRRKFKIEAQPEFPEADEKEGDDSPSSPDTPPINVLPVIDEIDPLLDSEAPEVAETSLDDFDAVLESSDRSVDGSVDSEVENQEEKENEVDGAKGLVTWTEDDEKNLMDLGTSELERNQRLENLIAKRRARKDGANTPENNLIDFESNDPQPQPQAQIPPITTAKSNPFDAPYSVSETDGLPPIPGSAPSGFVPKKNPFDLPYDPQEEKPNLTEDSFQQEFMSVFCRHESFNFGPSYATMNKQEKYDTKFTPYFANDAMPSDGVDYFGMLGQPSERRNSLSGALPESDSLPPIDPRNRKKQMGRALSLGVYPSNRAQRERKIPEMNPAKIGQELKSDANLDRADVSSHDTSEASVEEQKLVRVASSPEMREEVNNVKSEEVQPNTTEPDATGDLNTRPEPPLPVEESGVHEAHAKEPVYDSSPSAAEKRTIDEFLVYPDKGPFLTSSSSIASDMHVEISEAGSPRYPYAEEESPVDESKENVVKEKEVAPTEEPAKSETDAPQSGVAVHDQPVSNSNSSSSVAREVMDMDPNDGPPLITEPERHIEVQHDSVAVDSMAPSPTSDLDRNDHHEESQEASLKMSSEEVSDIDDVNVLLSNDNKDDANPIPGEKVETDSDNVTHSEVVVTKSVQTTSSSHEESHETKDVNVEQAHVEAGHIADGDSKQQHEEVGESTKREDGDSMQKEHTTKSNEAGDSDKDQNQ